MPNDIEDTETVYEIQYRKSVNHSWTRWVGDMDDLERAKDMLRSLTVSGQFRLVKIEEIPGTWRIV